MLAPTSKLVATIVEFGGCSGLPQDLGSVDENQRLIKADWISEHRNNR